ncbi:MAG: hypothetical protein J6112_01875 [Clostridia bacterium]|nr:hypothetical protein [Clostridia bacterium]
MKRIICALLVILAAVSLAACKPVSLPSVCFLSNKDAIADISVEYTKWTGDPSVDAGAQKTLNVSIDGASLAGTYKNTEYNLWTPDLLHNYTVSDTVEFGVNEKGEVIYYRSSAPEGGETIDKNKAEEIAKRFAKSIYPDADLSSYKVSNNFDEASGVYTVSFIKYIGERITFDHISLNITSGGVVTKYTSYIFGRVSDDMLSGVNFETLKKKIASKCDKLLGDVKGEYGSVVYDDYSYILTLDENGRPAYVVLVEIRLQNTYDGIMTSHSIDLAVYFANDVLN